LHLCWLQGRKHWSQHLQEYSLNTPSPHSSAAIDNSVSAFWCPLSLFPSG
jgi:hypothetical protein